MSDSEDDFNEKQLKVVFLGEQNVGKTNLIKKLCYDEFSRIYVPTIGADFYIKRITLSGNKEIIIRITDASGLELNGHMLDTYLFKVNLVILVYDITNCESFDSLIEWLRKIDEIMENAGEERTISIAVWGNKYDLEHKRTVRLDKTNHFIHDNKLASYFVSAKTGENVNSSFIELVARYFDIPLTSLEKDKQKLIIRAELMPNTPPMMVQNNKPKRLTDGKKLADMKKRVQKVNKVNGIPAQTCILQ